MQPYDFKFNDESKNLTDFDLADFFCGIVP